MLTVRCVWWSEASVNCHQYRLLLPAMPKFEGGGPYRSPEWVRWVMRAILLSKLVRPSRCGWSGPRAVQSIAFFVELVVAAGHVSTCVFVCPLDVIPRLVSRRLVERPRALLRVRVRVCRCRVSALVLRVLG